MLNDQPERTRAQTLNGWQSRPWLLLTRRHLADSIAVVIHAASTIPSVSSLAGLLLALRAG
jgi:hypothetical protein